MSNPNPSAEYAELCEHIAQATYGLPFESLLDDQQAEVRDQADEEAK
jgi:hypothetical protein